MDPNTAIFLFQMTVIAASLGAETCTPVNGEPDKCEVLMEAARHSDMEACLKAMQADHLFWYDRTLDPEIRVTGALVWVKCELAPLPEGLNYDGYEMGDTPVSGSTPREE